MNNLLVTIVQTPLFWEDKKQNLKMLEENIVRIERSEVVILPEMFTTGFTMNPQKLAETMEGESVEWMRRIASQKRIILTGSIIIRDKDQYFNRLIWMLPNGKYGFYDKRHLFAFAGEDKYFCAGKKKLITSVKQWKVQPFICYDLRFPVWTRQSETRFDLLIFVANWPKKRIEAWQTLLRARAIENQCFVAGVNRVGTDGNAIEYNGNSMVVDPLGRIIFQSEEECVQTLELNKLYLTKCRERFPFLNDADEFFVKISGS